MQPYNDDAAIITAVLGLAKALNMKVLAEGVENDMQLSFLKKHGCHEVQGYYFSEPLSAAQMKELLKAVPKYQPEVKPARRLGGKPNRAN
jgi:EAL domain-containing protein (putative c-di-GMP-specific phosphodiesterase class I)